jgi:tetratricopeptide (TPR) repeat protein
MTKHTFLTLFFTICILMCGLAQPTNFVTDAEKKFKDAKELFVREAYALAYPLLKELKQQYAENTISNHTYINDDVNYFYNTCGLKLNHQIAEEDAKRYIDIVPNEPRRQLMAFHLAKYYFTKNDFSNALTYYERAGLDNISNEEIADTKFEMAYSYFNLKQFAEAKPLFNEVHQLSKNKYYIPANYYYGFLCMRDRQYNEALKAFRLVEAHPDYQSVVPYYIAEIFYFQGKKDEALRYGESVLARGNSLVYEKEMKLLLGQLFFERKEFSKALPLLEYYVNSSDKVDKEVLYELSYCYYNASQLTKAITGFKQLSSLKDSMGQNSMYLLGDCYLRTAQKENARIAFQYSAYNNSNRTQQEASRFIYAKLSYELGYQDVALKELKTFIVDYPNSEYETEAKELLVGLLANTNNFADALTLYESMGKPTVPMQKVYPRILFGRAVEYINDGQTIRADELLTNVAADPYAAPIMPYVNFWRGELATRNQKQDDAIKYLTAYLQSSAPSQGEATPTAARYNLGYSWLKKENYKSALTYFEQVGKSANVTASAMEQDAYVRSADCYFMNKEYAKASSMYDAVINNALPQSDYAYFQKAVIAGVKSSTEKIKTLNTLTRQYPNSTLVPDVTMEIANTYMADEKFRDAIPYLDKLIKMPEAGGMQPQTYLKLGLSYYNIDDNKNALTSYQTLIQKYPQSPEADDALDNIKNIYVEEGRPNDYVELMRKNGKNISVSEADSLSFISAELKYNNNDCNAAIAGFTNYINQFSDGAYLLEANFYRSECYLKVKDWKNALVGYDYVNTKGANKFFEKATLEAARINYFELKEYATAKKYFESLLSNSINQDNQLEALRGVVRCYYLLKDYGTANEKAKLLLTKKGISTDDKAVGFLVLGKSQQLANDCATAITSFKSCAAINKTAWGAEARYEIANCYFTNNNTTAAEKAALAVVKETGSYDLWVTKSYILLGDVFMRQKDYFNAKATYESVAKNAVIAELKNEAQQKLDKAIEEEKVNGKVSSN